MTCQLLWEESEDMNNVTTYKVPNTRLGSKAMYSNIINRNNVTLGQNKYGDLSALKETRYFSAVDAGIYFGDVYIDECVDISFTMQQSTLPITGYNSYVFDTCAQGARIIQGSFAINFTKSNYLYEILNSIDTTNTGATLSSINKPCNQITMDKNTKAPMYNKCFNIVIPYGEVNTIINKQLLKLSTMIVLKGVHLVSCSQAFGTASNCGGSTIVEQYQFYARDIAFDNNNATETEVKNDVIEKEDITLNSLTAYDKNGAYSLLGNITINNQNIEAITNITAIFNNKYSTSFQYDDESHTFTRYLSTAKSKYKNGFDQAIATYLYKEGMGNNAPVIVPITFDYNYYNDDVEHSLTILTQVRYK